MYYHSSLSSSPSPWEKEKVHHIAPPSEKMQTMMDQFKVEAIKVKTKFWDKHKDTKDALIPTAKI